MLTAVAFVTAVGMLVVVRATSDQARLARVKRGIRAGLFEIRLFNDDLRAILRAQREIVRHNVTYLRLTLVPLLWLAVPLVLLTAQLHLWFGYEGLPPGQPAVLTARFDSDATPPLALVVPPGVRVETPPVWIASLREAAWRISAERPGAYALTIRAGKHSVTKTLDATTGLARRSPERVRGLLSRLLFSAEPALPAASGFRAVAIDYPERRLDVGGWRLHWMIPFFVLTMAFAFALKRRLRVVL